MGLISVTNIADGTVIDANDVNSPINTIVNEVNGNLSEANLDNSAVTTDKLADGAITTAKISNGAVTTAKISNPYKFSAYKASNQSITSGKILYDTVRYDTNNNFDSTNNRYTVPVNGYYNIHASAQWLQATPANVDCSIRIYVDGSFVFKGGNIKTVAYPQPEVSTTIYLTASQYVEIYITNNVAGTIEGGTGSNTFEIYLVSET